MKLSCALLTTATIPSSGQSWTASRAQALRFYTRNNAYLLFLDDQVGSLEAGKLADFIIVDRDLLNCSLDDFRAARIVKTYLGGREVYSAN